MWTKARYRLLLNYSKPHKTTNRIPILNDGDSLCFRIDTPPPPLTSLGTPYWPFVCLFQFFQFFRFSESTPAWFMPYVSKIASSTRHKDYSRIVSDSLCWKLAVLYANTYTESASNHLFLHIDLEMFSDLVRKTERKFAGVKYFYFLCIINHKTDKLWQRH